MYCFWCTKKINCVNYLYVSTCLIIIEGVEKKNSLVIVLTEKRKIKNESVSIILRTLRYHLYLIVSRQIKNELKIIKKIIIIIVIQAYAARHVTRVIFSSSSIKFNRSQ